jgi:hypothetical protein
MMNFAMVSGKDLRAESVASLGDFAMFAERAKSEPR